VAITFLDGQHPFVAVQFTRAGGVRLCSRFAHSPFARPLARSLPPFVKPSRGRLRRTTRTIAGRRAITESNTQRRLRRGMRGTHNRRIHIARSRGG